MNNSKLLVAVSCLNANPEAIANHMNLETDCLIINQSDEDSQYEFILNSNRIFVINSKERGLSKSRNMALEFIKHSTYTHFIFADDDQQYCPGYKDTIIESFEKRPEADIIFFDIIRLNYNGEENNEECQTPSYKISETRKHSYVGSVRIACKVQPIISNQIQFNTIFGTGSKVYSHGEDSIFIKDCRAYHLKIVESTDKLAKVDFSSSTWRNISYEKLCYDKGALWKELSPWMYPIFGMLLSFKMAKENKGSIFVGYKNFMKGAYAYNIRTK